MKRNSLAKRMTRLIESLPREILTCLLVTMLALPAPYLLDAVVPSFAVNNDVPEKEIESSIDVAKRFNSVIAEYEDNLSGYPVDDNMILDTFYLLPQEFHQKTNKVGAPVLRAVSRWNVKVGLKKVIREASEDTPMATSTIDKISTMAAATFENSRKYGKSSMSCPKGETCYIEFTQPGDDYLLNNFRVKVDQVVTYGNYVLFTKPNSYNAETKSQEILFINLDTYEGHLGNEAIPVFEVTAQNLSSPIEALEVIGNKLHINKSQKQIIREELDFVSNLQEVHFNLQAGLVSPGEIEGTLPLARSFQAYADKAFSNHEAQLDNLQATGYKAALDIRKEMQKMQDSFGLAVPKTENRKALTDDLKSERFSGEQIIGKASAMLSLAKNQNQLDGDANKEKLDIANQFIQNLNKTSTMETALRGSKSQLAANNRFFFALKRLGMYAMAPKPEASKAIRSAISSIVGKMAKVIGKGAGESFIHRVAKKPLTTIGLLSGAVLGVVAPEAYVTMLHAGIDMASSTLAYVKQIIYNGFGQTFGKGIQNVWSVVNPFTLMETVNAQYIEGDQLHKTATFMKAFIPSLFGALMGWYYTNNAFKLIRDSRKPGWKGFTQAIKDIIDADLNALAEAQAEKSRAVSQAEAKFSQEDTDRVQAHIKAAQLRDENKKQASKLYQAYNKTIGASFRAVKSLVSSKKADKNKIDADPEKQNRGTWWAIRKFMFSTSLFKRSMTDLISFWNFDAGMRGTCFQFASVKVKKVKVPYFIRMNPVKCYMRLMYPRFFNTATKNSAHLTLPTKLNGGLDGLGSAFMRVARQGMERVMSFPHEYESPEVADHDEYNEAFEEFEEDIVQLETLIGDYSLKATLNALVENLKTDKELRSLYLSQKGVDKISSETIVNLNNKNRTFFRLYYDSINEAVMEKVMNKLAGELNLDKVEESIDNSHAGMLMKRKMKAVAQTMMEEGEVSKKQFDELKEVMVAYSHKEGASHLKAVNLMSSPDELKTLVDEEAKNPIHAQKAKRGSNFFARTLNPKIVGKRIKHDFTAYLDPTQNGQMNRIATVRRKMQDPHAVSRAMKSETTEMFVTLPIDLAYVLLLSSGISDPMNPLKPIQDVENGANSFYYGSRMMFYSGFISGIIQGQLGSAWVKLQEDAYNDDAGNFGKVPKDGDKDRSFFRWWLKQYNSPENTLGINYQRIVEISWQNMPNALVNIARFKLLFLGRLDLELVVLGYLMAFITPLPAWFYKVEQAFELAAFYDAKDIPEELISHPLAQEYIEKQSHKRRVKYNIIRDILLNPVAEVLGQAQFVQNDLGTRGMMRALMPDGVLPTEHLITMVHELAQAAEGTPLGDAANKVYESCVDALVNGNPEITELPEEVKQYLHDKYPGYPAPDGN